MKTRASKRIVSTPKRRAAELFWWVHTMADTLLFNERTTNRDPRYAQAVRDELEQFLQKDENLWLFEYLPEGDAQDGWGDRVMDSLDGVRP